MHFKSISAVAAAVLISSVGAANAAAFLNSSLSDPPGVYFGAGNSNSNFTVDRTGNTETGISAIQRYVGPIVPVGSTYFVSTNATAEPGKFGSDWGITFSVNINVDGTDTKHHLSDTRAILGLQDIRTGTSTNSFNLLTIPDNTEFGAGGKCIGTFAVPCDSSANYAFQNSETLSFPLVALALGDPGFDFTKDDTYIFTLSLYNNISNILISTNQITVIAGRGAPVPEPITLSLFGAGVAGAFAMRRRKARKA